MPRPTHYDVLGVPPSASAAAVRDAYRRLAREHHPDRAMASGSAAGAVSMPEINEAYRVLNDPARRAVYDASLRNGPVPPRGPAAPPRPSTSEPAPTMPTFPSHLGPARFPWRSVSFFAMLAIVGIVVLAQFTEPGSRRGLTESCASTRASRSSPTVMPGRSCAPTTRPSTAVWRPSSRSTAPVPVERLRIATAREWASRARRCRRPRWVTHPAAKGRRRWDNAAAAANLWLPSGAISSAGRAPRSHRGGREIETPIAHRHDHHAVWATAAGQPPARQTRHLA